MDSIYKKVAQVANYLARKNEGQISKLKLVKLVYLADRYHLRKYGRPITGDSYLAMRLGPVGSATKDIASFSDWLEPEAKIYASEYLAIKGDDPHTLVSLKGVDADELSETDIEALDFVYENFAEKPSSELVDITHTYPEWKKFKPDLDAGAGSVPMNYIDFFDNPENRLSDKFQMDEKTLQYSKEIYEQDSRLTEELGH